MSQVDMNKEKGEAGCFVAFVLLSDNQWDTNKFIHDFRADWNIEMPAEESKDGTLVVTIGDMTLATALMPGPVPDGEAEHYAAANYMWPEAVEVVGHHQAHILISVFGKDTDLRERGKLFTKAVSSCLKQPNALAVYTDGAVFQPEFYREVASFMQEDEEMLPVLDWVWFGIGGTDEHAGIYTYGLRKFGKEEIEVYADADLNDVRSFLIDIVSYLLEEDIILQDGETIGFSEEQKLRITLSKGIAVDGMTLKIDYPG